MNTQSPWESQTQEMLNRIEQKIKEIQEEADRKTQPYFDKRWALIQSLEAYRELMGTETMQTAKHLTQEDIQGKSQTEILKLIAGRNDDLLVVRTAIKLMKDANIFGNPENADAMVYSILSRSKDFIRVGKGVYKIDPHHLKNIIENERMAASNMLNSSAVKIKLNNPISFQKAVIKVLQESSGESLTSNEIWQRMQALGVTSNSKKPEGWVNRIAAQAGAEKMAPNTWRWKTDQVDNRSAQQLIGIPSVHGIITTQ